MRRQGRLEFWFEEMARVNSTVIDALTARFMKELLKAENFEKGTRAVFYPDCYTEIHNSPRASAGVVFGVG